MFDGVFSYRYYEDDQRISFEELNEVMAKDSLANFHWKRAKTKNTFSNVLFIASLAVFPITANVEQPNPGTVFLSYLGLSIGSFILASSRQNSKRRAILRYNSLFDPPKEDKKKVSSVKLSPILMRSSNKKMGKGISLQINF